MTWGIGYFMGCEKGFTAPQTDRTPGFMSVIRIVLFQPDIPQNVGAVLRLGACFNIAVEIIEPCGFVWDDKRIITHPTSVVGGLHFCAIKPDWSPYPVHHQGLRASSFILIRNW